MRKFYFALIVVLCFCPSAFAGVGSHDNRYYVTDEMWATEPYKKFVNLRILQDRGYGLVPYGECSGQYISPNLILSAGHCTDGDGYQIINYKHETFPVELVQTPYKQDTAKVGDLGDWAVWLVTNPQYYSDSYFNISVPTQTINVINAGWGWARIFEDQELYKIREILEEMRKNSEKDFIDINAVSYSLSKKMIEYGLEPISDYHNRLKASECKIIFEDCSKLFNVVVDTATPSLLNYEIGNNLPRTKQQQNLERIANTTYKKFVDMCNNQQLLKRWAYPNILATTCDSWGGNSGGGYISESGNQLYGICSFGADAFTDDLNSDYIASALQFNTKIKTLIKKYDSKNPVEKNISKIPNRSKKNIQYNDFQRPDDIDEEYPDLDISDEEQRILKNMNYRIQILQTETGDLDAKLMYRLSDIRSMTDDQLLGFLNKMVEYQVKSEQLEKLQQAYEEAKAREQSFANRALTAATVAMTGLGGMQWASGVAEQNADQDAERDMLAYIATMKCEYGNGQHITIGNEEITLPGGNELLEYFTEYKEIAERLKETKTALGLRSGIEGEVLYDHAQTGLYQYATADKTGGAETSLYRALTDESGADAAAWAEQQEGAAKKKNIGATVAGTGAIGGAVGNMIINKDQYFKDKNQDSK